MNKSLYVTFLFIMMFQQSVFGSDLATQLATSIRNSKFSERAKAQCIQDLKTAFDAGVDPNIELPEQKMGDDEIVRFESVTTRPVHLAASMNVQDVIAYIICRGGDPRIQVGGDPASCYSSRLSKKSGFPAKFHAHEDDYEEPPRVLMQNTQGAIENCGGTQQFIERHNLVNRARELEQWAQVQLSRGQ